MNFPASVRVQRAAGQMPSDPDAEATLGECQVRWGDNVLNFPAWTFVCAFVHLPSDPPSLPFRLSTCPPTFIPALAVLSVAPALVVLPVPVWLRQWSFLHLVWLELWSCLHFHLRLGLLHFLCGSGSSCFCMFRVARPSVVFACPRVAPALVVFAFLMWLGVFTFCVISVVARAFAGLRVAPAMVVFACSV